MQPTGSGLVARLEVYRRWLCDPQALSWTAWISAAQFWCHLADMEFEIIGEIAEVEPIAVGRSIRDLSRLRKMYGPGRWRKLKGIARVRLRTGRTRLAELHWYEAHGIGKKNIKRKRYLD